MRIITKLTELSGKGMKVLQKFLQRHTPKLGYGYEVRTDLTELSGKGMEVFTLLELDPTA